MIPIVIIHKNFAPYVETAVEQALIANQGAPVYLISDFVIRSDLHSKIRHIPLEEFFSAIAEIRHRYLHLGVSPVGYECFNFERWFILRDFMKRYGVASLVYQDSDVLLFASGDEIAKRYSNVELTLSNNQSPHISLWKNQEIVSRFCNFCMGFYNGTDKRLQEKVISWLVEVLPQKREFNICDMFFFQAFAELENISCGEMTSIVDGMMFLNNFNCPDQETNPDFENDLPDNPLVKIIWQDHKPFIRFKSNNKDTGLIRTGSIHFQGNLKGEMRRYFEASRA